jgi:glycosyltransferase involved in cell wall biosynthesis
VGAPILSVVIPAFNRERELERALDSCCGEPGEAAEVIVVDDGSTDRTAEVAAAFAARGVRLLRLPGNRGSSPARTVGIDAASGEWIVRLDSDDALVPGGLAAIRRCTEQLPPSVGRFGLMYRYTDGRVSPFPPPTGETLDYEGFIRWLEHSETFDCLTVTRRSALAAVPYPSGRLMEMLHHLDFARRFDTVWIAEVGAVYHLDAAARQSRARSREEARQDAEEVRLILERHGETLAELAPRFLGAQLRQRTVSLALAGERLEALREGGRQLYSQPLSPLHWAAFGGALVGRALLERALRLKWDLVEKRRKRLCRPPTSSLTTTTLR